MAPEGSHSSPVTGQSVAVQQDAVVMHCPLHSFWPGAQAHWLSPLDAVGGRHCSPPVQSMLEQHALAPMHCPLHTRPPLGHWHIPITQDAPVAHVTPALAPWQLVVAPQNCVLLDGSTHTTTPLALAHCTSVPGHDAWQCPSRQLLFPRHCSPTLGPVQSPVAPQNTGSVSGSTQVPLQGSFPERHWMLDVAPPLPDDTEPELAVDAEPPELTPELAPLDVVPPEDAAELLAA